MCVRVKYITVQIVVGVSTYGFLPKYCPGLGLAFDCVVSDLSRELRDHVTA